MSLAKASTASLLVPQILILTILGTGTRWETPLKHFPITGWRIPRLISGRAYYYPNKALIQWIG